MSEGLKQRLIDFKRSQVIDLHGDLLNEFIVLYQERYRFRPNKGCGECMAQALTKFITDENL